MKATATFPDGSVQPLIRIKDWNFYWQDLFLFDKPLPLPKGTRIDVEAHFDNSAENPLNPNSPPKRVRYGEQTTDEMCYCFFLVATKSPYDLRSLITDNFKSLVRQRVERFLKSKLGRLKK